jgi:uncharacterized protein (DUF2225 family)
MTRVGRQTFTCPNCGQDFSDEALYSTSTGGLTSEFRPIALGMQPEPYYVHTCTSCGLSGWDTVFEGDISPEVSALVAQRVTPLIGDGPPAAWRRYEFAAWVARWQGTGDDEIGYMYLCAAWCADDRELPAAEASAYRRHAIECYENALDSDLLEGNQRAELTYLVGELHRRVGEVEAASAWFGRVAGLVEADETGERLAALAQRQRAEPSDVI